MSSQSSPGNQNTTGGKLEENYEEESNTQEKYGLKDNIISTFKEFFIILIIILLIIGCLSLYTNNWPPLVVVESDSMMHDEDSKIGVMDTGDIVLLKKISSQKDIKTYIEGQKNNYKTYGSYGDVIGFKRNGGSGTPLIHRAIVWIEYNESGRNNNPDLGYQGSFDIPSMGIYDNTTLTIENFQPNSYNLTVDLQIILDNFANNHKKPHGGFITKGDNNDLVDQVSGLTDNYNKPLEPVKVKWIDGEATGEVPGLGLIKIYLTGKASVPGTEPPNSNNNILIFFLVVIITILITFHLLFWRIEKIRRRKRELQEIKEIIPFQNILVRRIENYKKKKHRRKVHLRPKSVKHDKMFSYFYDIFEIKDDNVDFSRKSKPKTRNFSFSSRTKRFFKGPVPKAIPVAKADKSFYNPNRPLAPMAKPRANLNYSNTQKTKITTAPLAKPTGSNIQSLTENRIINKEKLRKSSTQISTKVSTEQDYIINKKKFQYSPAIEQSSSSQNAPLAKPVSKNDMYSYIENALELDKKN